MAKEAGCQQFQETFSNDMVNIENEVTRMRQMLEKVEKEGTIYKRGEKAGGGLGVRRHVA